VSFLDDGEGDRHVCDIGLGLDCLVQVDGLHVNHLELAGVHPITEHNKAIGVPVVGFAELVGADQDGCNGQFGSANQIRIRWLPNTSEGKIIKCKILLGQATW